MNKLITIIILSLFFITSDGWAQDNEPKRSGFGIRAGVNASNIMTDANADVSFKFGPTAGIYVRLGLFPNLTIQPELLYSLQGAEFDVATGTTGTQSSTVTDRLHYLNLPVLVQFWLNDHLNIHAGPYAGVLMDVSSSGRNTVSADYQRWDYGGAAGIEYEFPFGLNIGGRYNLGLYDIDGAAQNVTPTGPTIEGKNTNQFFQLYVGFTF